MLSDRDVRCLLQFLQDIGQLGDLDDFPGRVVDAAPSLVPCARVSWNEVDRATGRMTVVAKPEIDWATTAYDERFAELAGEHPVIAHFQRTHDGRPYKISDFLTADEFHRLSLYEEVYRPLGAEDQMFMTLPTPPPLGIGVALSRTEPDFTERDRNLLNLARPNLVVAYRNAALFTRLRTALDSFERLAHERRDAIVVLTRQGVVEYATPRAIELLDRWFGPDLDELHRVCAAARASTGPAWPTTVERDGHTLSVRVLPGASDGADVVVLDEASEMPSAARLAELGLTDRQAEVLAYVVDGCTNEEIARALDIRVPTVKKHLENVYARLGVQNRVAATQMALQCAHPPLARLTVAR